MAHVNFANAVQRHVDCPSAEVRANTVRQVFDGYFERFPAVRGYVLDERGAVRKHIAVFVDGELIEDRVDLSDAVDADGRIDVFQALSGG